MAPRLQSVASFFVQFLPLSLFASYAYARGEPTPERWYQAFILGASLSFLRLLFMAWRKMAVNPIIIGTDLYLYLGLVTCMTRAQVLIDLLAHLQATGFLAAILLVGIAATALSPRGYVFAEGIGRAAVVKGSLVLLAVTVGATAMSYAFRGDTTYSGVIPAVMIALSQRGIRTYAKATSASSSSSSSSS